MRPRPTIATIAVAVLLAVCSDQVRAKDLPELEQEAITAAVARVAPSVIRIQAVGGLAAVGRTSLGSGPCTGLVVSPDGYIVSSSFNFARKPATILVELPDGPSLPAKLIARDHSRSLVLLKVDLPADSEPLAVPEAAPDDEVAAGAWAIALGRTFDAAHPNISVGIVSATGRIWGKAVQTDAKVSPSNYGGPLVDIRGRVMGILVPMSPQSNEELAGAEWYDSGIGFAVPLSHIRNVLPKLKAGNDLRPGVMGITLKSKDQFGAPPVVAAAQAGSPAAEAGLKSGDKIVEAGGRPVQSQAQLKHQIGPLYAGDDVQLTVLRGDSRMEFEFQLTDKLPPYAHPFLGILPRRAAGDEKGVGIRYVFPDSGAEQAGLQAGDRITKLGEKKIAAGEDAYDALAAFAPEQEIQVTRVRGDETETVKVTLGRLPSEVPAELPAAHEARETEQSDDVGAVEIKLPEFKNECFAYVPENYDPEVGCGVVVWLPAPGKLQKEKLIERWKPLCEAHDLILLVPQSRENDKWQRDEVEFVGGALAKLLQDYKVDGYRSVVHGYQTGGAMAFLVMAAHHAQLHGLAVVDASMPAAMRAPPLNPTNRVAVYWAYSPEASAARRMEAKIQELRKLNYPVTERQLDGSSRYLNDAELDEMVRWIDSLDRI